MTLTPSETLGKGRTFQKCLKSNTSYLVTCVFQRVSRGRKNQSLQVFKCDLFSVSNLVPGVTVKYSELSLPLYLCEIYRPLAWLMTNSQFSWKQVTVVTCHNRKQQCDFTYKYTHTHTYKTITLNLFESKTSFSLDNIHFFLLLKMLLFCFLPKSGSYCEKSFGTQVAVLS